MKIRFSITLLLSLLLALPSYAAVTRGATTSSRENTTDPTTDGDITHTVDSGTTLLIISVHTRASESVSGTPQWSLGGGENLTLIHASTSSSGNGDNATEVWGLISPTSGAGTVDVVINSGPYVIASATNYIGTETASVAAATNYLSEDVNDAATSTSVHASAGNAGNALYFAGTFRGGDGDPASNATSFFEIHDGDSGGTSINDGSYYVADLLNSAPEAITVTWATSDENASVYVEIVAAATGVAVQRRRHSE